MSEKRERFFKLDSEHQDIIDEIHHMKYSSDWAVTENLSNAQDAEIDVSFSTDNEPDMQSLHPFVVEACEAVVAWYKERHPRRTKITTSRLFEEYSEEFSEFFSELRQKINDHVKGLGERKREIERELHKLAPEIAGEVETDPDSDDYQVVFTTWYSTYQSQGFGRDKYTKQAAESKARRIIAHGVEAEVGPYMGSDNETQYGFEVRVKCSEDDVKILKNLPPLTDEEFAKFCKDNGVNPHVYRPFMHKRTGTYDY